MKSNRVVLDSELGWLDIPDGSVFWRPNFYSYEHALALQHSLIEELDWQQEQIMMYGRSVLQPRLQAWYGDKAYRYSGLTMPPKPWTSTLARIKADCETVAEANFNSVLANWYRNGADYMGWHQDNEKQLGHQPVIASVSFGEPRRFLLRHISSGEKWEFILGNGDLLVMAGDTQQNWQHSLAKTAKPKQARVNLTFRNIVEDVT